MTIPRRAHPLNVVGDFYVEDGCCTLCGVPEAEAPELFGPDGPWSDTTHCYVRKQPATVAELLAMIRAINGAELRCIRYRGRDQATIDILRSIGELEQCDELETDRT